jgi:hypothetical protein
VPKVVIFALNPAANEAYEYKLTASGGSGSGYYWQSKNSTIAAINSQGVVRTTASRLGHSAILVTDARNQDIQARASVYVLEPVDLAIQSCPVETQVNTRLRVNIQMNAIVNPSAWTADDDDAEATTVASTHIMPITDCSRLKFDVTIQDETVFKFVGIEATKSSKTSSDNEAASSCAVVVLEALRVGRTGLKITTLTTASANSVEYVELKSNEMLIGSYSQLKSLKSQLVLSEKASFVVDLYDGPLYSSLSSNPAVDSTSDVNYFNYYQTHINVSSDTSAAADIVNVVGLEQAHKPNRYSFRVTVKKNYFF